MAVALYGAAAASWSLGLGRVTSTATLGQPLAVTLPVRLDAGEALAPECVSAEVHFGDNRQPTPAVQVGVVAEGIRITTITLIDEPVVTAQVTVGCTSRLSRQFTLFADPPAVNLTQASQQDAMPAPRSSRQTQAPAVASRTARTVRPRPTASPRVATEARATVRAPASSKARVPKRTERAVAATPRLQLDPIDTDLLADQRPRLDDKQAPPAEGASPQRTAAATTWRALNATPEEMARDREELRKLEEQFAAVRRDNAAMRNSLVALEARLLRAEEERYANPLVFGLTALCALLLLLLGSTWWRQRRQMQAAWWNEQARAVAETMSPPSSARSEVVTGAQREAEPEVTDPTPFTTIAAAGFPPPPAPQPAQAPVEPEPPAAAPPVEAPRREVSVEELIDLEQQAEFFVVLGQDDAAIDLLMSHVRNTAGTSPLPYLKLLEIYQHRGDRAEYDRIRDRFNNRFNAYAPSWGEGLMRGRTLEDYPEVTRRLESLWAIPAHALDVLQASLLRQDESAGTFDLPAYRELLFLYSIARDLSDTGRATGDVVDLLLPLGDEEPGQAEAFTLNTMGPLVAEPSQAHGSNNADHGPVQADEALPLLDLDLDVDMASAGEPKPEPRVRHSGLIEFERLDVTQPLPRRGRA